MRYERHNDSSTPSSFEMERIAAFMFKASIILDPSLQKRDMDIMLEDGDTVSVKTQNAAGRTGNISLEVLQTDTRTGETIPGNFVLCEAKYILFAVPDLAKPKGCYDLWLFEHEKLKGFVAQNSFRKANLTPERLGANRGLGKKYDDTTSVLVPLRLAQKVAIGVNKMDFAEIKKNQSYRAFAKLNPIRGE